jgi:multidrug efflux pump subunit AcrA (membrane-fusion protein)
VALASGKAPVLAVPRAAIVQVDGQPHVYVQRDPEAFFLRPIKTGDGSDRFVAVADGVGEGDRIVTVGVEKMPRK